MQSAQNPQGTFNSPAYTPMPQKGYFVMGKETADIKGTIKQFKSPTETTQELPVIEKKSQKKVQSRWNPNQSTNTNQFVFSPKTQERKARALTE